MRIVPVPCLRDNYAYLLIVGDRAAVVDPSEAAPVLAALAAEGARPVALLCTHHHYDHVGGVPELLAAHPGLPVYGHRFDQTQARIPNQSVAVDDGQHIDPFGGGAETSATVLHVPGHTLGAVAYFFAAQQAVFTGDTLFLSGCGRLFEGDAAMMHASLSRLAALPADTQVFCGHEYTESNLRFAAAVEPENAAVAARRERVAALRAVGQPTVPATLAEERATNPFLRTAVPAVRAAAAQRDPRAAESGDEAQIFGVLRNWKDSF